MGFEEKVVCGLARVDTALATRDEKVFGLRVHPSSHPVIDVGFTWNPGHRCFVSQGTYQLAIFDSKYNRREMPTNNAFRFKEQLTRT